MKGTEKIIEQINEEAAKKADAIIEQAKERCSDIRKDYEKQARELYTEKIRAGVTAGQQRLERMQSREQAENQTGLESEKRALVEKCFALAMEKLTEPEQKAKLEAMKPELEAQVASMLFD